MMKICRAIVAVAALAPWSVAAVADDSALAGCAKIASPLDRLECYDALAHRLQVVPAAPGSASAPVAPAAPVAPTAPVAVAAPQTQAAAAAPADFGFESQRINETPDEVNARYDGEFLGWSGQTLFKLDNGQVWKQAQSGRVSYRRSNPAVTIRKGAFGSFRLSVEGLNKTIRVKRIK
jgi:hypothetical protein